ncbi:hypothetical protein BURPS305_6331 [Burkholderia pseudomallei 305]|nr:hypothetical protein BURPS305_6331 [Burkholderia pseudomallei 305]
MHWGRCRESDAVCPTREFDVVNSMLSVRCCQFDVVSSMPHRSPREAGGTHGRRAAAGAATAREPAGRRPAASSRRRADGERAHA